MTLPPTRAWSALHGPDARETRAQIALAPDSSSLRWADAVEAIAALAEVGADVQGALDRLEAATREVAPSPALYLWLGRLYACASSHARASDALAVAESGPLDDRQRAIVTHSRGMLASARRDWRGALREFRAARDLFSASDDNDDPVGALLCAISLGATLTTTGLLVEAHDELLSAQGLLPPRGLARTRWTVTLASLQSHRGELEDAAHSLATVRTSNDGLASLATVALLHTTLAELASWREDYVTALSELDALRARAASAGSALYEGFATYTQAVLAYDAGAIDTSLALGREAAAVGRAIDVQTLVDGGTLTQATALAARGERAEALVVFRSVRAPFDVETQPSYGVGQLATIELLLAERSSTEAERAQWLEVAKRRAALLCKRDEHGAPFCERTLTNRILWRRLLRTADRVGLDLRPESSPALCVSPDGTTIRLAHDELVTLSHRPVLTRILAALADAPRRTATLAALASKAWPEDRSSRASIHARIRVAIATLRQLGLGDAIETVPNGYRLACDVGPVVDPSPRA
jgi:hypothetical protein